MERPSSSLKSLFFFFLVFFEGDGFLSSPLYLVVHQYRTYCLLVILAVRWLANSCVAVRLLEEMKPLWYIWGRAAVVPAGAPTRGIIGVVRRWEHSTWCPNQCYEEWRLRGRRCSLWLYENWMHTCHQLWRETVEGFFLCCCLVEWILNRLEEKSQKSKPVSETKESSVITQERTVYLWIGFG
jgi:hypothetical protein